MNPAIFYGIVFLWSIFFVAIILSKILSKKLRGKEFNKVLLRIKTWFYIITIFSSLFVFPHIYIKLILLFISILALLEIRKAYFSISIKKFKQTILTAAISIILVLCMICAYHLFLLNTSVFFFIVVITQLNDIFQYLWGKSFGKKLIVPKISPNKTWMGFIGGAITSGILSYSIVPYYVNKHGISALLIGIIISCLGFLGDITVSYFKRQCSVKDLGTFLPGHGGLMDRLDSLLYVIPITIFILKTI